MTESKLVVNVARPEPLSVPVPSVVAPSLKVTVPVGVTEPDTWVTVAVNVTLWPHTVGFVEAITAVVLLAFVTVWVMAVEAFALKFVSPL